MKTILASKSPRRTEILSLMNIEHIIIPSTEEEIIEQNLTPEQVVQSLAYQKANSVAKQYPTDLVIGSDTIVVINNQILGKPKDYNDAVRMLLLLQNNTHQVMTGVSLIKGEQIDTFVDIADVTFKEMTKEDIDKYLETDKPFDKAGAYGIQDPNATFIKQIKGDYYTIMGLPKEQLQKHIKQFIN